MEFQSRNGRVVSRLAPNIRVSLEAGKTYTFAVPRLGIKLFDRNTGTRLRGVSGGRG
jgi:hypothetical protein